MGSLSHLIGLRYMQPRGGFSPIVSQRITALLGKWVQGDQEAGDALMPLVYDQLRRIARRCLRGQSPNQTIHSGTLVHEAYFKLVGQNSVEWQNRAHFFGVAAQVMRRILVDHARRRLALKRGASQRSLSLDVSAVLPREQPVELIALDAALNDLAKLDPRQARVVELRFFGGLSIEETAELTGISPATVKREWVVAKAWLHRELRGESGLDA